MSAFEYFFAWTRRATYLWVDTPTRAWAFAVSFGFVVFGIFLLENGPLLRWLSPPPDAYAREPLDVRLTRSVLGAARSGAPVVLGVGGSTMRELLPADEYLSSRLTERCGHTITVVNGGSSSQDLTMSWVIADAIPSDQLKVLVLGMNYFRLTHNVAGPINASLPFGRTQALRQAVERLGGPGQEYSIAIPGIEMLLSEAKRSGFFLSPPPKAEEGDPFNAAGTHYYKAPALSAEKKQDIISRFVSGRQAYVEWYGERATAFLEALVAHFVEQGVTVVALAIPEDPALQAINPLFDAPFRATLDAMRKAGAIVEDWRTNEEFVTSDFYDQQHFLPSGRRKISPKLLALFARGLGPVCPDGVE